MWFHFGTVMIIHLVPRCWIKAKCSLYQVAILTIGRNVPLLTLAGFVWLILVYLSTQIAKFMGPTWGPSGSCRPQMGPMLAPWTLLSGNGWTGMLQLSKVHDDIMSCIFIALTHITWYYIQHTNDKHINVFEGQFVKWHKLDPVFFFQFLAATKQLYKWYFPSVCPSVRLSVCPIGASARYWILSNCVVCVNLTPHVRE